MNTSPSQLVAQAVAEAAPSFPPPKRADLYDALSELSRDPDISSGAMKTAHAIREAESAQILFKAIVTK